jgi:hypothetical protein
MHPAVKFRGLAGFFSFLSVPGVPRSRGVAVDLLVAEAEGCAVEIADIFCLG